MLLKVFILFRRLNSGTSNAIDTAKLHVKNVVLNQWKLIAVLKSYISKYTEDKTFEKALNREFVLFLQKIDPKVYGADLTRYFTTDTKVIEKNPVKKEQSSIMPTVLNGLAVKKEADVNKIATPKWKYLPKSTESQVRSEITKLFKSFLIIVFL